jgi:ferredoxin
MTYVIAAPCVADYSCVEVCPVQCISPRPDDFGFDNTEQLFINPNTCIDCEACVSACPVGAIYEVSRLPLQYAHYAQINAEYFELRPNSHLHIEKL